MEKKTIEQMRNAVLTFCDELDKEGIRLRMMHKGFTQIQKIGGVWAVTIGAKIHFLYDSFEGWEFMYSALGLAERDAVAAERGRLAPIVKYEKDIPEILAYIKGDQLHSESLVADANTKIARERTRNTALVAALQSLKIRAWDAFNKIELAAVQKGAVGRIKRQYTIADTKENDSYIGEILKAKRIFDAQVDELIAANTEKGGSDEA